jgi:putative peptide zinc metalloprotease protein
VTIVLFLAEEYLVAGVVLGIFAVVLQVVLPIARQAKFVMSSPVLRKRRIRALGVIAGILGSLTLFVTHVPFPASTYAQGIVWLPERSQVRANVDGFISQIIAQPQSEITEGAALIETADPLLKVEVERLEWELLALQARFDQQIVDDRAEAGILQGQIERVAADLTLARERAAELTIVSPTSGTFLVSRAHHLTGRFIRQGNVLGYVTDLSIPNIRAVVKQTDIALVRDRTKAVKVRLADDPGHTIDATILQHVPSATDRLPGRSLGSLGGGLVTVDPKDPEGTTATEDIFLVDIALPQEVAVTRVGTRVHIRFEHESEPLAGRLYRMIRQLLLSRFTV